jgi:hypothetical protein
VIARHREHGWAERTEQLRRALELLEAPAMREIAGRDDQLRLDPLDEPRERTPSFRILVCTDVEVGYMEEAGSHERTRLYIPVMAEESTEIFDDLYLGIRAGGALRKQRRGEELTHEEKEALSRWQRLSTARKAAAIGAFAFGTFGLGFTLGGLVFGRWRGRTS